MKNKLDQHIDNKLKTSFDGIQKKAPGHLWEKILEEMNVEDALNASLDENVQAAHLEAPLHKAPSSIWDNIDKALEETTPIDTILDKKVKDGFLSDSKAAPVFLWGAISEELNSPPVSVDTALDDKLKEGFLTQETKKTPNKVWYAVSRQLNIDKTWDRISKVLDKEPVISDWSGRVLRFFTAAALLLLLLKTCTNEPYTIPNSDLVYHLNSSNVEKSESSSTKLNNSMNVGLEKQESARPNSKSENDSNSKSKKEENLNSNKTTEKGLESADYKKSQSLTANNKNLIGTVPTSSSKHSSKERKEEPTKGGVPVTLPKLDDDSRTNSKIESTIISIAQNSESPSIGVTLETRASNVLKKESVERNNQNEKSVETEARKELNPIILDALAINPLFVENTVEPIQLLDEISLEKNKKTTKNLIEGKLEAGAFAVVNSTMLLNNETREGFDQNSLTTNYFGLAANYGIWASYRILPRGALVAEFSINADNRQAYGTYEKGVFYIKEWVMKYNRLSLAYKHDLWQTNSDKLINTKVVAQAGVYVGMMREAKLFYDGVLFFDKQSDYHQFDFGFKVALGQEILIDKFVLGYGIRSDIGASNIFRGNNQLRAGEDQTNIIHLGGYVLFGYRF